MYVLLCMYLYMHVCICMYVCMLVCIVFIDISYVCITMYDVCVLLQSTVYRIVLLNGGVSEYEQILAEYRSTEDNQVRKYAMFTLGASRDVALKTRTLDWALKSGEVKMQDLFYPVGAVTGSIDGAELGWKYFQDVR